MFFPLMITILQYPMCHAVGTFSTLSMDHNVKEKGHHRSESKVPPT